MIRIVLDAPDADGFAGDGFDISGVGKAAGANVAANDFLQILFEERDISPAISTMRERSG